MLKATLPNFSGGFSTSAHSLEDNDDDKLASKPFASNHRRQPSYQLQSLLKKLPLPRPAIAVLLFIFLLLLYILFGRSTPRNTRTYRGEPRNWGDYVGQGLARAKLLSSTPLRYADLGDRWTAGSGPFYRARRSGGDKPKGVGSVVSKGGSLGHDSEFETQRRGVLGGASTEWSSGVVGMGDWLGGVVDMRKGFNNLEASEASSVTPARAGLASHILESAWTFKDAEDQKNTEALLIDARLNKFLETLPLRDRVRDDPIASKKAADMWSSIYGALEGESVKSALEVAVEKLVRRVPVVIFSKTTCPHSKRAKALFSKYHLSHEPYIVEVDLRPDGSEVKKLLGRRTLHQTFPNIIIGSRSIGGAAELDELENSGELKTILAEAGVTMSPR